MKLSLAKGFALATLFVAVNAKAGIITIEPDDYAEGASLATPYASISYINHTAGAAGFTYQSAIAVTEPTCLLYNPCYAPTGSKVLSDGTLVNGVLAPTGTVGLNNMYYSINPATAPGSVTLNAATIAQMGGFQAMRVDFAAPTDYFSADFYGTTMDPINIFAFAADGTFLSFTTNGSDPNRATRRTAGPCEPISPMCSVWEQTLSVQHATADISFVIYGSTSSSQRPDALRFNVSEPPTSVPEPSTMALAVVGLLVILISRRRPLGLHLRLPSPRG